MAVVKQECKFVYGILPAFVSRVPDLPPNILGQTSGIFIKLSMEAWEDVLTHELVHVKQWYRTLFLHGLLQSISRTYKIRCEIEAYKAQGLPDPQIVARIAWDLGVSEESVRNQL